MSLPSPVASCDRKEIEGEAIMLKMSTADIFKSSFTDFMRAVPVDIPSMTGIDYTVYFEFGLATVV